MLKASLTAVAVTAAISGTALADQPLQLFEQRVVGSLVSNTRSRLEDLCARGYKENCKTPQWFAQDEARERAKWAKTVRALTPAERNCLRRAGYKTFRSGNDLIEGDVPKECNIRTAKRGAAESYYYFAHHTYYNAEAQRCWDSGGIFRDWQCRPQS